MTAPQEVTFTLLRERDRVCSACNAPVTAAVMVRAARSTASVHFLFCRHCSARIGVVGGAIGKTNKQRRTASGG